MAFTVYGLMTSGTPAGPYYTSSDVTAITGGSPAVGALLYGFVTGGGVSKFFVSTANSTGIYGGTVVLPALATPNTVPIGAVQIGTSAIWATEQAYPWGLNEGEATGQLYFAVTPAAGSPDVGSPTQYEVDPYTLFIVAAANYQWNM